ncbi:hypothetical protein KN815_23420 [Streptomyces sp. 4503]|uniref:HTH araC/xylS-type domain-containing protein n=1 Tax=Streptomyces niphimycinicus TaxID=2842201 RepID=A0ABS6CIX8_9ACTN|nr:hypothetical protein [Streptomyces niphimycinicus]MBU3866906.1 hypothetical protein [Streptomyces niphimycinicus]
MVSRRARLGQAARARVPLGLISVRQHGRIGVLRARIFSQTSLRTARLGFQPTRPQLSTGRAPHHPSTPPDQRTRTSAIRQLALQAPAPVIAQALGYHDKSTTRIATEAGAPWKNYAPGVHNRRSPRLR